jgi:hypothetical protein
MPEENVVALLRLAFKAPGAGFLDLRFNRFKKVERWLIEGASDVLAAAVPANGLHGRA